MKKVWKKTRAALGKLHLADKCLLVFMSILMLQSINTLFFQVAQKSDALDVIVRTTAAAIFGYFISANFQNGSRGAEEEEQGDGRRLLSKSVSGVGHQEKAKIGFSGEEKSKDVSAGGVPGFCKNGSDCRNQLQILVIACIGIFALIVLLISRNFVEITPVAAATISQLRDFVSGSVGFLIGHSTHREGA